MMPEHGRSAVRSCAAPRAIPTWLRFSAFACALLAAACAGGPTPEEAEAAELQQALTDTRDAKAALDALRAELVETTDESAAGDLETRIADATRDVGERIVDLLNRSSIVEGEPLTDLQREAVRLKSSEDLAIAQEFIDNRANYGRAIEIYRDALALDPDNEEVLAALAEAESMRYVTAERFAAVYDGMRESDVLGALGPVKPDNIRGYSQDGREAVAWFYPREDGGAAGVWFRDKNGTLEVFEAKFDQVPPQK